MTDHFDLKKLIEGVISEGGRAKLVEKLVDNNGAVPPELIEEAISCYAKRGFFNQAIEIAVKAGLDERTKDLRIKMADHLKAQGFLVEAAYAYKEAGLGKRAIDLLAQCGVANEVSGICFGAPDLTEYAIDALDNSGCWQSAAFLAEQIGLKERAKTLSAKVVDHLEAHGMIREARGYAQTYGLWERAADICEKMGDLEGAADISHNLGLDERARELYVRAVNEYATYNLEAAVKCAQKAGLKERVKELLAREVDYLEDNGCFAGAAVAARKAGLVERAEYYAAIDKMLRETD